jgi:FG-GAP repeat
MSVVLRTSDLWIVGVLTVTMPSCDTSLRMQVSDHALEGDPVISTQQAQLLASDGAEFDQFGIAVAVSGDIALVGARFDDDGGSNAGAAYVFVRSGATWTQQAKITAADAGANDELGASVALFGNTAVLGATSDDDAASDGGAIYVFVRSGTTWTQQAKLTVADAVSNHQLGVSVALSGDTLVAGTVNDGDNGERAGAAYVFVRSGTTWTQQAKLVAADGAAFDQFGISVAASGNTAVVGAFGDDDNGRSSGSAYIFARSGTTWTQQAKLLAADGAEIDEFGVSVAASGDTALIGAIFDDDLGSAYAFVRSGTSWTQQAKLTAADGSGSDNFGAAVALDEDTAVIGAPGDGDLGAASGSTYVFARSGGSWTQRDKLTAAGGAAVDFFGAAVALSGRTAVIGALGDDDRGSSAGAAYVFTGQSNTGEACGNNAACTSGFCSDGVCCNTACGGDPNDCQACSVAAGAAVNGTCSPRGAGNVCRAAAGACDVAEPCNGASPSCPSNQLASAGTVCRAAASACDARETCTGSSAACPSDAHRPDLSLCHPGLLGLPGLCLAGHCVL